MVISERDVRNLVGEWVPVLHQTGHAVLEVNAHAMLDDTRILISITCYPMEGEEGQLNVRYM